jgi:predicted esterase
MPEPRAPDATVTGCAATAVALALILALSGCKRSPSPAPPTGGSSAVETLDPSSAPWCGEGYRALDEATCLALPPTFAEPPSLVIFAHGMIAPSALPTEEQATLLAASRAHGFAVLFGRGKQGLCAWQPDVTEHYCWPTTQAAVEKETSGIVARWSDAQARAERLAGVRLARRYLVGFSNGGYFVAFVAVQGRMPIDGAAVVGAGRSEVDLSLCGAERPPLYLAVGDQEAEGTRRDAATLAEALTQQGWPVKYVVHEGRGHGIKEDDLAASWAAWGR